MSTFLGDVEKGKSMFVVVDDRDLHGGRALNGVTPFSPTYYDVWRLTSGASKVVSHVPLPVLDVAEGEGVNADVVNSVFNIDLDTSDPIYVENERYLVVVKEVDTADDIEAFRTYTFRVTAPFTERLTVIRDRLEWIRNDIENVVFPRLQRVLGLMGENSMLDLFDYDSTYRITGLRVRLFSGATAAANATRDLADSSIPESGEIATYRVTQAHNLPQGTRQEHKSYFFDELNAADIYANENTGTDYENAPGNDDVNGGQWPIEE